MCGGGDLFFCEVSSVFVGVEDSKVSRMLTDYIKQGQVKSMPVIIGLVNEEDDGWDGSENVAKHVY